MANKHLKTLQLYVIIQKQKKMLISFMSFSYLREEQKIFSFIADKEKSTVFKH